MTDKYTQDRALTEAQIAIGQLEVQFTHMSSQLEKLETALSGLNTKLDTVNATLNEARGGWRTLMAVGGAAASAGAAVSWIGQHIKW